MSHEDTMIGGHIRRIFYEEDALCHNKWLRFRRFSQSLTPYHSVKEGSRHLSLTSCLWFWLTAWYRLSRWQVSQPAMSAAV